MKTVSGYNVILQSGGMKDRSKGHLILDKHILDPNKLYEVIKSTFDTRLLDP